MITKTNGATYEILRGVCSTQPNRPDYSRSRETTMASSHQCHAFRRLTSFCLRPPSYRLLGRTILTQPVRNVSQLPVLKSIKDSPRIHTRFFSSRPYPHRRPVDNRKPPLLGFLDSIPHNTVFYGIITLNGVVFLMWYMSSERMVSFQRVNSHFFNKIDLKVHLRDNNVTPHHTCL